MTTFAGWLLRGGLLPGLMVGTLAAVDLPEPKDLGVTRLDTKSMRLTYTSDTVIKVPGVDDQFRFKLESIENGRRATSTSGWLRPPSNVFTDGLGKDRFFFAEINQRNNPGGNGGNARVLVATIEDRGAKQNTIQPTKGMRNGIVIRDHTVTLRHGGQLKQLPENGTFRIPFGAKKGPTYTFAGVDARDRVIIARGPPDDARQLLLQVPPNGRFKR